MNFQSFKDIQFEKYMVVKCEKIPFLWRGDNLRSELAGW